MMINENENVLKGQYNLAQGNALGLNEDVEIVRAIKFFKGLSLFRTKRNEFNFVRKKYFALIILFQRTISMFFLFPRALPWAELYWPFRPRLVYKVMSIKMNF